MVVGVSMVVIDYEGDVYVEFFGFRGCDLRFCFFILVGISCIFFFVLVFDF